MKRFLAIITAAAVFGIFPAAYAATLIGGEQINRTWTISTTSVGHIISGTTAQGARPAFRVLHNGSISAETRVNGQSYFSGAMLVNLGGKNGTGVTVDAGIALEVIGTASGINLYASRTFDGAGLSDCDTAGTSKLLWDFTTKRFSCGTDSNTGAFGTGNVLTIGDARYVNQSGDTMTGALLVKANLSGSRLIISENANISGALLVVGNITTRGTLSGSNLTVSRSASISGTLIVKTGITSKGSVSGSTIDGFGLGSCNSGTSKLLYNSTTDQFECGTISASASSFSTGNVLTIGDARYLKRSGGTMTGNLVLSGKSLMADVLSGTSLKILGTGSGNVLHAEKTLTSSGTITAEGTISGATIRFSTGSGHTVRYIQMSPVSTQIIVYASGSALGVGSGKSLMTIKASMSGYYLTDVRAKVQTAGITGTSTFRLVNRDKGSRQILSTVLSIDSGEKSSLTAATPYVINQANADFGADDTLDFQIASTSTTAPKGLNVIFTFAKP